MEITTGTPAEGGTQQEHVSSDGDGLPLHHCPHLLAQYEPGTSHNTPSLGVNCNDGPGARRVASSGGGGAGSYDLSLWTNDAVWSALDFAMTEPH